jgi:hypothetical protein
MDSNKTRDILEEVLNERIHQIELKHGGDTDKFDKSNTKNDWVSYIAAYSGRASDKVLKNERDGCSFRANMIKTAALAIAAIEAHDNGWC